MENLTTIATVEYRCMSTSEKLQQVKWFQIRPEFDTIYFESCYGVFEEEAYALDLFFQKLLRSEFVCDGTFHHQGVYSATISINREHQFWKNRETDPKRNVVYWAENFDELFKT